MLPSEFYFFEATGGFTIPREGEKKKILKEKEKEKKKEKSLSF